MNTTCSDSQHPANAVYCMKGHRTPRMFVRRFPGELAPVQHAAGEGTPPSLESWRCCYIDLLLFITVEVYCLQLLEKYCMICFYLYVWTNAICVSPCNGMDNTVCMIQRITNHCEFISQYFAIKYTFPNTISICEERLDKCKNLLMIRFLVGVGVSN